MCICIFRWNPQVKEGNNIKKLTFKIKISYIINKNVLLKKLPFTPNYKTFRTDILECWPLIRRKVYSITIFKRKQSLIPEHYQYIKLLKIFFARHRTQVCHHQHYKISQRILHLNFFNYLCIILRYKKTSDPRLRIEMRKAGDSRSIFFFLPVCPCVWVSPGNAWGRARGPPPYSSRWPSPRPHWRTLRRHPRLHPPAGGWWEGPLHRYRTGRTSGPAACGGGVRHVPPPLYQNNSHTVVFIRNDVWISSVLWVEIKISMSNERLNLYSLGGGGLSPTR